MSQVDNDCENTLHWACKGGHEGIIKCLVRHYGFDMNLSLLNEAAYRGPRDVVEFLVCMGANVSQVGPDRNYPLHCASKGGQLDTVKYLVLQCTVDINSRGAHGITPLMWAASMAQRDVFDFLMSVGANSSCVDIFGNSLLHYAFRGGSADMIQRIISQDMVDINIRGGIFRRTTLMDAARGGKLKILALLVNKGALTHLVDNKGRNILHIATTGGSMEMVKYILSKNLTDIKARDKDGKTAAMLANDCGFVRLNTFLVLRGSPEK
ncbi:putative ankyrin repeat protein RF_0381 [Haliotis rubra]|uniref:putative ankyrin repeat protein RF_0381 n=1 Tax=Haliotis rubra TaxID=36100 RepID=UPI001EE536F4|nr:putative ankyrin repeat protein RF_0381 [Haliotis rubra]